MLSIDIIKQINVQANLDVHDGHGSHVSGALLKPANPTTYSLRRLELCTWTQQFTSYSGENRDA
jgi:hypothetical protein